MPSAETLAKTACLLFCIASFSSSAKAAVPADLSALIDRVDADWLDAMKAKDAAWLAEPYADDALFILPDGRTIIGRAAIAAFYRTRLAQPSRVVGGGIVRQGSAEGADGLVYEWGQGGATSIDERNATHTSLGPYLTVWKRGADGRWRIVRNLVF